MADSNDNNKSISLDFVSRLARRENRERNEKSRGFKTSSRKSCLAFNIAGCHEVEYTLVAVCARFASKRRISIGFVGIAATAEFRCETPSSSGNIRVTSRVRVLLLSNRAETVAARGELGRFTGLLAFPRTAMVVEITLYILDSRGSKSGDCKGRGCKPVHGSRETRG